MSASSGVKTFASVLLALAAAVSVADEGVLHGRVLPLERITAKNAKGDESQKAWSGRAWRNERVHAAFALWGEGCGDITATAEPLVGPGGAKIPLKVRWVREVIADDRPHMAKVDPAKYPPYRVGDILDEEHPFKLTEDGCRGVWASAKTPADAPVGTYRGKLCVKSAAKVLEFPLELEVVADALPAVKEFHLDIWQTPWTVARYYNLKPFSPEHYAKMEPFFRELADAGQKTITTTITDYPWNERKNIDSARSMVRYVKRRDGTFVADFSVMDGFVAFAEKCGIGPQIHCYAPVKFERSHTYQYFDERTGRDVSVRLLPATPEYEAYWGPLLAQLEAHAKEKGWVGRLYVALDELPGKETAATAALIAKHAPSAKFQMAGNRVPSEFRGVKIDSYSQELRNSRYVPKSFYDEVAKRRSDGQLTTVYTCCNPFRPNCLPMNPLHEQRWIGLFIAAKGFDGYLKSTFFRWVQSTDPLVDTHCYPNFPCGDSYLAYPGPRLSLRWESMVDGFEDWEKIRILKETGRFTPALAEALGRIDFVRFEKSDAATVRADVEACLAEIDRASAGVWNGHLAR